MKVLLTEDNATIVAVTKAYLAPLRLEVHAAKDGKEGLEIALRIQPDLILSDAQMPNMDGFQFCAAVRANAALRAVPFVIFTGQNDEATQRKGRMVGVTAFLSKGIPPAELTRKVAELLNLPPKV